MIPTVKQIFLILSFTIVIVGYGQNEISISHDTYHQYQGEFEFEDGSYITGGPMGELKGSLVYLNPVDGEPGGVFLPESKTVFTSAILPESDFKIKFEFDTSGNVDGLWWVIDDNKKLYAKKEISPRIEEVKFNNGNITLAGELLLPKGDGPFPAVILVHGSGRQNRHSGPWASFFIRYGIAVLSYDKRGVEESTGRYETAGYEDLASDVIAGIELLKNHPLIDEEKIGIKGSSEGGWVGSIAAANSPEIAFFIVRAGSGVSGFETYMHEVKNELRAKNLTKDEWVQAIRLEREYYTMALSNASIDSINSFIRNSRQKYSWFKRAFGDWDHLNPEYRIKMKETGPIDPTESLRNIKMPVLWFLADNDENVPYEISKPRIKLALQEAGNDDYEIITLNGVKHNFLFLNEDGSFKYVDGYWTKMADWLKEHDFVK